jgi:hypothetical protein
MALNGSICEKSKPDRLTRTSSRCPRSLHFRFLKEANTMCDFSLMAIPNRLAVSEEDLIVHRFEAGSVGLASALDLRRIQECRKAQFCWFWPSIKAFFIPSDTRFEMTAAVSPASIPSPTNKAAASEALPSPSELRYAVSQASPLQHNWLAPLRSRGPAAWTCPVSF